MQLLEVSTRIFGHIWTVLPRARRIWQSLGSLFVHRREEFASCVRHSWGAGVAESLDSQVTRHRGSRHSWHFSDSVQ